MNIKTFAIIAVAALCFMTLMLYLLIGVRGPDANRQGTKPAQEPLTFSGRLDIRLMTDLRVAGRKVILCGVSFNKPAALEPLVREQARRAFQGTEVECAQVGAGTPCDGNVAASFNAVPVVQCRRQDGADIAGKLSEAGFLCDMPVQSGSVYNAC